MAGKYEADVYAWLEANSATLLHFDTQEERAAYIKSELELTGPGSAVRTIRKFISRFKYEEDGYVEWREDNASDDVPDSGTWNGGVKESLTGDGGEGDGGQTPAGDVDTDEDTDDAFWIKWQDKEYRFRIKGHTFTEPFQVVEQWCRWYPYDGHNNTQRAVTRMAQNIQGVTLTKDFVRRIFALLGLTKDAPPYAPHWLQKYSPDECAKLHFQALQAEAEIALRQSEAKEYRKLWRKSEEKKARADQIIDRISEGLPRGVFNFTVKPARADDSLEPYTPIIMLTDWHVGACVKAGRNSFNKDVFAARVERIKAEIDEWFRCYRRPVERVKWALCGDMVEGSNMRTGQGRELDLFYEEQTHVAAQGLRDVIAYGRGLLPDVPHEAEAVGGNHGRGTPDRDDDPARVLDMAVYQIAEGWTHTLDIDWTITSDIVHEWRVYATQVLQSHGERIPRDFDKLIRARLDKTCASHMVITGHYHSEHVEGSMDSLAVQGGSLIGDTPYGLDQIGVRSQPSQRIIEVRRDGPRIPGQLLVA